ncbi:hypothetical protein GCM10023168_32730 [Fodinibacter luteus]|uniref:Small CPxCG-related zinc finger protein n=1 Tax=Fodinibacter luteus TaxID=552064 RepID=A0ABP8KP84_9MICO
MSDGGKDREPGAGPDATASDAGRDVVCATCGAAPGDEDALALARITWTRGVENGRDTWTCDTCSRRHLRSIEGKLDSAWW